MREFFKYVFATIVGIVLSALLIGVLFVALVVGLVSSLKENTPVEISDNSVLYLNLDQAIVERTPDDTFANLPVLGNEGEKSIGFNDVVRSLAKAKEDDRIKCVYISVTSPNAGFATMKEVRNALEDFKTSGKKVIAYSEVYTQGAYYLASVADQVYLNPEGELEFKGLSSKLTFFKGALDKLGIEAQIIRVGTYKSAVEPFINEKMSDKNREQVTAYIEGLYSTFLKDIAISRKISPDSLRLMADDYKLQTSEDALAFKMVDGLKYKDEILDVLKKLTGKDEDKNLSTVTLNDYAKNLGDQGADSKAKIAVIYANGEITGGEGNNEVIGSERLSRTIRKVRQDSSVKGIVLRVNSPGGSALASDVIWREIILAKKVKPVIASFGDVAASGGYYIGCAADSIFVQPNSITGSIGVFGIIPNLQNLLNNKLGITFDQVKTGKYADIMSVTRPLTEGERFIIQNQVNRVYNTFIEHVSEGRHKSKAYIDSIGGGRVWVGTDAVRIGLADRTGSFNDAINAAAKKAGIKRYRIAEFPEVISPLKSLLREGTDKVRMHFVKQQLGDQFAVYEQLKSVMSQFGIQARIPFQFSVQ